MQVLVKEARISVFYLHVCYDNCSSVSVAPGWSSITVKDATMLVFVTPHQFVEGLCKRIKGKIKPHAIAISLIKGMEVQSPICCFIIISFSTLLDEYFDNLMSWVHSV